MPISGLCRWGWLDGRFLPSFMVRGRHSLEGPTG